MKVLRLKKVIAIALIIVSVSSINTIGASAEWKQNSNGWWNTEGSLGDSVGWKEIDEKWYYFGQDGYMVHDTIIDAYIIDSDGAWIQSPQNNLLNSENIYTPAKQSREELYQDVFVSLLLPDIRKAVADYYKDFLTESPIVSPEYVHVLSAERTMGYRSFSYRLKLEVVSYIGPHIDIGDDYITVKI